MKIKIQIDNFIIEKIPVRNNDGFVAGYLVANISTGEKLEIPSRILLEFSKMILGDYTVSNITNTISDSVITGK